MSSLKRNAVVRYQGVIFILLGLIAMFCAIQWHAKLQDHVTITHSLVLLLQTLGVAVIVFGLFQILLESRNWRNYFAERLREIVIEQDYLNALDTSTLRNLQTNALKALLRDPNIDREGGFLDYFNNSLHGYISAPYREAVSAEIVVQGEVDDCLIIRDRVQYTCRAAANTIQERVTWQPDPDEFESVEYLRIEAQHPAHHERRGDRVVIFDSKEAGVDVTREPVDCSLEGYRDIDGLVIHIDAQYAVLRERLQYWEMAHPTRNFEFTVVFPDTFELQLKPMVLHDALCNRFISATYGRVTYDSWMLPSAGVAWRLIRRSVVAASSTQPTKGGGETQP